MQSIPSLLGRDILNLCAVTLDYSQNLVRLEPRNLSENFMLPTAG